MAQRAPAAESAIKREVQSFWDSHPCGSKFTVYELGSPEFFQAVEAHRYGVEPHIQEMARFAQAGGKRVLEIGCGLGTDGAQFAGARANYTAIDLTPQGAALARRNFRWRNLPGEFCVADGEALPFRDESFDLVYSHGVLHHTPNTQAAIDEVHRVLKPGGQAIIMLYHKGSVNYYAGIMGLRRLGALLLYPRAGLRLVHKLTGEASGRLSEHRRLLRRHGLRYLTSPRWLAYNTDGAGNPYSQVFTAQEALRLFSRFRQARTETRLLNLHWLPVIGKALPKSVEEALARRFGWHLYILAEK